MVPEVTVLVHWLHCFWACGEAEQNGRRAQWSRTGYFLAARKQRATERGLAQDLVPKGMSPVVYFLQLGPASESCHQILNPPGDPSIDGLGKSPHDPVTCQWQAPSAGNKPSNMSPFGGHITSKLSHGYLDPPYAHHYLLFSDLKFWKTTSSALTYCMHSFSSFSLPKDKRGRFADLLDAKYLRTTLQTWVIW
jgi:hypothetical protein